MKLPKKIITFYIILVPLISIPLGLYLSSALKNYFIERLEESLLIQGKLIIDTLPEFKKNKNMDAFALRMKEKTKARVTIIFIDGTVLGDSDKPSRLLDNHLQREEIRKVMIKGYGSSIRYSDTLKKNLFYIALPTDNTASPKGFVRLAYPITEIEDIFYSIKEKVIIASFSSLIILILAGLYLSGSITKRIKDIVGISKDIAKGDFHKKRIMYKSDEIGDLGRQINIMAEQLEAKMKNLSKEKELLVTVLSAMRDGIIVTDIKKNISITNQSIKNILGTKEDITGQPLFEVLTDPSIQDALNNAGHTNQSILTEIEIFTPIKKQLYVTITPLYLFNTINGFVIILHDITKIKHLETVRKDFVANVSHEIKTPITAIKGFAETLLDGALDNKEIAYKYLSTIKNHSERLNSLVQDLLTLANLDKGKIDLNLEKIDIRELIELICLMLKEKASSKNIELVNKIPDQFAPVNADKNKLTQIFINLIDNAVKFTETGTITINSLTKGNYSEISVEDTGIGIKENNIPRLGERFYRIDSARSRALGGTGLGLAIVKHLVQLHGWEMKIQSSLGKGTKITLMVPA